MLYRKALCRKDLDLITKILERNLAMSGRYAVSCIAYLLPMKYTLTIQFEARNDRAANFLKQKMAEAAVRAIREAFAIQCNLSLDSEGEYIVITK